MDWTEIKIEVSAEDAEKAGDIAQMVVPYGIYTEDYSDLEDGVMEIAHIDLIDEELLKKDRSKAYVHVYISPDENPSEAVSFLKDRYEAEKIAHTITCADCKIEDWQNNWKKYFHPIAVGEKLLIRPTWRDDYNAEGRTVLSLDPGLAFGSGTHETTRLCLAAIEKYVTDDSTVLDVGCGSGILAVAALLLGAKNAVGVDIDPVAVRTAGENAQLNNVADRLDVKIGNLTDKVDGKFDIIAANIVADAIIMLSKDIKNFMKKDSVYIMSGIVDTRVDEVLAALDEDFCIIEKQENNGWYCLTAKLR